MYDISVRIGKNLLTLRKKNGLTQADVSAHLKKSFFAYSNYETGKRTISIEDLWFYHAYIMFLSMKS